MKYSIALIITLLSIISCRQIDGPIDPPDDDSTGTYYTLLEGSLQGTLSRISSPYFAGNPIWVDSLKTLTIEPGVEIYFGIPSSFEIRGRLQAVGNALNPILFTSYQNYFWKGITVSNSQQNSILQFAIIENIVLLSEDSLRDGSIELENASVTIQNCIIRNNRGNNGGGIAVLNSSGVITNNLILNNEASVFGGAIFSFQSTAKIINNTIYGNSCFNHGGGVVLYDPILDEVQNNIFYQNTSTTGDPRISILQADSTQYLVQYNFLSPISQSPGFISTTNFHLNASSPCINQGNPDPMYNDVNETRNDQGAYGGPAGNW